MEKSNLFKKLKKEILDIYKSIDFIIVFGSYAKEHYSELSDIDIAIHFSKMPDILELGYIIAKLEAKLCKKIDIIILNELYKKNAKFCRQIITEGIVLYVSDNNKFIEFKKNSLLYYLDLKDLYEKNIKKFLERIERNKIGEQNYV